MKYVYLLTVCALMWYGAVALHAESKVITTVNGTPETRELVRITFDGDYAILNFADNTTETADMSLVNITLTYDDDTALKSIISDPDKVRGVYNLKGQRIADTPEGLKQGIYIINGQKVLVK